MASEYKRFRDYELMVVLHPELSEEDVVTESDRVQGFLTSADASVTLVNREPPWGRRRLAYPIRHGSRDLRDGIYVLYYFTSESNRIEDIEREIKLDTRVIRYLLTLQLAPIMEPAPPEGEGEEGEAPAEITEPMASETRRTRARTVAAAPNEAPATEPGVAEVAAGEAETASAETPDAETTDEPEVAEVAAGEAETASAETPDAETTDETEEAPESPPADEPVPASDDQVDAPVETANEADDSSAESADSKPEDSSESAKNES